MRGSLSPMSAQLLINGVPIRPCSCSNRPDPHWSGNNLLLLLGRGIEDSDEIEIDTRPSFVYDPASH